MVYRQEITPHTLKKQKVEENVDSYIEIYENHLLTNFNFYAEHPIDDDDEDMGWEMLQTNFTTFALKKYITGIEKNYAAKSQLWELVIFVTGFSYDIKIHFKSESDINIVYNKIYQWLIT